MDDDEAGEDEACEKRDFVPIYERRFLCFLLLFILFAELFFPCLTFFLVWEIYDFVVVIIHALYM